MKAELSSGVEPSPSGSPAPEMSVIVPCYHDAGSVAANLELLTTALEQMAIPFEVVVVVDGDPETYAAAIGCQSPLGEAEGDG